MISASKEGAYRGRADVEQAVGGGGNVVAKKRV